MYDGVTDGLSSASMQVFSRELMGHAEMFAHSKQCLDPSDILHEAYSKQQRHAQPALSALTAPSCVQSTPHSGFSALRRTEDTAEHPQWVLFFQTTEQTHFQPPLPAGHKQQRLASGRAVVHNPGRT